MPSIIQWIRQHFWNTKLVPAENLGVKNAAWDRADKLFVPRDCYNSYSCNSVTT